MSKKKSGDRVGTGTAGAPGSRGGGGVSHGTGAIPAPYAALSAAVSPLSSCVLSSFVFFQAEDGIRDVAVTGVQTCALPIYLTVPSAGSRPAWNTNQNCSS